METHLRSIVKGLSWRIIATLVTTIVVWLISGEVSMALFAGASDSLVKIGLFWGHERLWQRIRWGRIFPTVSSP
jgi:adenylylsulfate kinase